MSSASARPKLNILFSGKEPKPKFLKLISASCRSQLRIRPKYSCALQKPHFLKTFKGSQILVTFKNLAKLFGSLCSLGLTKFQMFYQKFHLFSLFLNFIFETYKYEQSSGKLATFLLVFRYMQIVTWYLLLVTGSLLLTACYLLLTICFSPLATCYLLLSCCHLLVTSCYCVLCTL